MAPLAHRVLKQNIRILIFVKNKSGGLYICEYMIAEQKDGKDSLHGAYLGRNLRDRRDFTFYFIQFCDV